MHLLAGLAVRVSFGVELVEGLQASAAENLPELAVSVVARMVVRAAWQQQALPAVAAFRMLVDLAVVTLVARCFPTPLSEISANGAK